MEKVRLKDLVEAVDGQLLGTFQDQDVLLGDVVIDSRKVKTLDVFFALIGERFDAHDFVSGLSEGLGFVISQDLPEYQENKFYVKVADTTKALGDFAGWYRQQFEIPFIAVTGSVGKTTAKDMIASVLSSKFKVHKTQGNFNNTIGLPLTIFQLEKTHEICVLEMGMDTAGEIDYMSNIAKPDLAVITNIGDAHIERLGSRENIKKAKYEVIPHLKKGGILMRDGDTENPAIIVGSFTHKPEVEKGEIIGCGNYDVLEAEFVETDGISSITGYISHKNFGKVTIPAMGIHMFYPTLFAIAVGEVYGMTETEIKEGISNFIPTKMRMNQVNCRNNITILDDCYNANPQSMKASINVLADYKAQNKVAILGDMLELGQFSDELHGEIGSFLAQKKIDICITVGEQGKIIGVKAKEQGVKQVFICEKKEDALPILNKIVTSDMALLVKASRGMALETIVESLKEQMK